VRLDRRRISSISLRTWTPACIYHTRISSSMHNRFLDLVGELSISIQLHTTIMLSLALYHSISTLATPSSASPKRSHEVKYPLVDSVSNPQSDRRRGSLCLITTFLKVAYRSRQSLGNVCHFICHVLTWTDAQGFKQFARQGPCKCVLNPGRQPEGRHSYRNKA